MWRRDETRGQEKRPRVKRKTSSINIKRKKQETERRSDHIGGSSSRSGKGRKVPLLTYILKAVAMHGDMGDGDDDDPTPPPPLPAAAAAAAADDDDDDDGVGNGSFVQTLGGSRAANRAVAASSQKLLLPAAAATATVTTRSNTTEYQQNINRPSTEHQQNFDRPSTEHQQNFDRPSTEHQQNFDRPSTEHQQNFDRASTELRPSINSSSCIRVSFIHHTLSPLRFFIYLWGRSFFFCSFFFPRAPTRQNISTEHPQKILRQLFALGFFIHPPHSLLTSASFNLGVFFCFGVLLFFFNPRASNTTEYQQNINSSCIIRVSFIHHTFSPPIFIIFQFGFFLSLGSFFSILFFPFFGGRRIFFQVWCYFILFLEFWNF